LICAALASGLTGCVTPQQDVTQFAQAEAFTLERWKLQSAIGCLGEKETAIEGGGTIHEFFICGGLYSDAHCTPWRMISSDSLIARCTYTVSSEHRAKRLTRYLLCEGLDSPTGCGSDYQRWEDLGSKRPAS